MLAGVRGAPRCCGEEASEEDVRPLFFFRGMWCFVVGLSPFSLLLHQYHDSKQSFIKDFNIRMAQFFDYYLKGAAKPVWMERGVPAIEKGVHQGLELIEAKE